MSDELVYLYDKELENELRSINEYDLPEILSRRVELIVNSNAEYEKALKEKRAAQKKVKDVLDHANVLIEKAEALSNTSPAKRVNIWGKPKEAKEKDRIKWCEDTLRELASYGINSAEIQKELADVENAVVKSQTALLKVQESQLKYQECISDGLKYVFGLTAYSMASVQSIVKNMELILSGDKKKDVGEMARQQMFLVMKQLSDQENMITRLNEQDERQDGIEVRLDEQENINKRQEAKLKKQIAVDHIHDRRLDESDKKDAEQDELLQRQIEKDLEHDIALRAGLARDKKQDTLIAEQKKINYVQETKIEQLTNEIFYLEKEMERLERVIRRRNSHRNHKHCGYSLHK